MRGAGLRLRAQHYDGREWGVGEAAGAVECADMRGEGRRGEGETGKQGGQGRERIAGKGRSKKQGDVGLLAETKW